MSQTIQFCPECGEPIINAENCKKCGYNSGKSKTDISYISEKRLNLWKKIKPSIKWIGTYSWFFTSIFAFTFLIIGFIRIFTRNSLWSFIFWGLAFGLSLYFLKPYSEKYKEEQWYYLVNDVWVLGNLRLPKLLILSLSIDILLLGFGGLITVIPIVLVIFLGPTPYHWLTDTIQGASKPPKEPKLKKEKKVVTKEKLVKAEQEQPKEKKKKPVDKKPKKEQEIKKKVQKNSSEKNDKQALYDKFNAETGKKAIWKNAETKAYIAWEESQNNTTNE
ncbi:hypothetical protein NEF87_000601 [Candidatus Lokiarchaeum ossiferum]|uniref:Zinc ribbon domain-containing protein n=1 Tax=Candidatus Lokiarchaeum ossiferum TaxID=2951803 RepID=A0ABY6HLN3_9ARCH|nr:hypothetical protein NEF87_000601 [Candidatus Lokiarchaeum sp. B-35]